MEDKMKRVESVVNTLPSTQSRVASGIRRTQTVSWNEELTQGWRFIDSSETLEQRVLRYISYLKPTDAQLNAMSRNIQSHIADCIMNKENDLVHEVSHLKFDKSGEAYAVDLGSRTIVAVKITKNGNDVDVKEAYTALVSAERDLTSPDTTAYELFDAIADTVSQLPQPKGSSTGYTPIAFVCSFDVQLRTKNSMYLKKWSKGLQVGRNTDDPVEGSDMAAMLDTALRRKKMNFRVTSAMNDLVTAAVLGMTQLNNDPSNEVRFMMNLGTGFNVGSICSNTSTSKSKGDCYDMRVNQYDSSIPRADFDLEVDWADGNINENPVEKLVAAKYLGEIVRRVILKVFNTEAPKLAWSRGSFPTDAAARVATDDSDEGVVIREIIKALWEWDIDAEYAEYIKTITVSVFTRSASLVAASLCAVARANNGLIPALGGSIVAVSGSLYNANTFYQSMVRNKIDSILGPILSRLLILEPVKGGSAVGAALTLMR